MNEISNGSILIADPFLKDPNFLRTAVLLCACHDDGCIGFVLNRKHDIKVGELVKEWENCDFPVYYGGPVQLDTLQFVHCRPDLISGGVEISKGIFWGGNFEEVTIYLANHYLNDNEIRFFVGYSGWGEGQLQSELKEKSWLVTTSNQKLVFHDQINKIWEDAIKQIGGEYLQIINYPIDPQLN